MTEQTEPYANCEPYGNVEFTSHPISMNLGEGSVCFIPKFMEALITCRLISGSEQNRQVEEKWVEGMLRMQGEDGLFYAPTKGRPWFALINTMGKVEGGQIACLFDIGGTWWSSRPTIASRAILFHCVKGTIRGVVEDSESMFVLIPNGRPKIAEGIPTFLRPRST